jgi:hypothetical protein
VSRAGARGKSAFKAGGPGGAKSVFKAPPAPSGGAAGGATGAAKGEAPINRAKGKAPINGEAPIKREEGGLDGKSNTKNIR